MTLIEVMIGFLVMGILLLGALSGIMYSWRSADSNLRSMAAMESARSIGEQMMTLDFAVLALPTLPVDLPSLPGGSMNVSTWNMRTDDVHNTPANPADDLVVRIRPEITFTTEASGARCARIVIDYTWEEHSFFIMRMRSDSITLVRSPVSAF